MTYVIKETPAAEAAQAILYFGLKKLNAQYTLSNSLAMRVPPEDIEDIVHRYLGEALVEGVMKKMTVIRQPDTSFQDAVTFRAEVYVATKLELVMMLEGAYGQGFADAQRLASKRNSDPLNTSAAPPPL